MAAKKQRLGLPGWILIGAVAGICFGVFLGDYARILQPLGQVYIQLLAICVYPYVIASLLHGLGKLDPPTAWRLFKHAWPSYVTGWGIAIGAMVILGAAFPAVSTPAVLDPKSATQGTDVIGLLIPGNPFHDLTRNAVPAVVVFALLYGTAIQRVKHKASWLEVLLVVKSASVTIWNWVVFVAPVGVFALLASVAGTIQPKDIASLFLYTALYLFGAFLLAFWFIPVFLTCVIPVQYREVLRELKGAFALALVTTLAVAALPGIIKAAENLLEKRGVKDDLALDIIGTNISVAYPLTQLGNLGLILFFCFCSLYYKVPLTLGDRVLLPVLTLFSTVGSPSTTVVAVPFLSSIFNTPESTLSLWMAPIAFTRYAQVALSVAGFSLATLWPTLAFYGKVRLRPGRIVGVLVLGFGILGGAVLALRAVPLQLLSQERGDYLSFSLDSSLTEGLHVTVYKTPEEVPKRSEAVRAMESLDRIRSQGVLRVSYDPVVIPFCYLNANAQLVGYDMAFMYKLAKDMKVSLEFVPMTHQTLEPLLLSGEADIAANSIQVTEERMRTLAISRPYIQTSTALLARSPIAPKLTDRKSILAQRGVKVACQDSTALLPLAEALFPSEKPVLVRNYEQFLSDPSLQVAPWTLLEAKAFALAHPGFTAVVPEDFGGPVLIAYFMAPGASQLLRYVDHWIEVQEKNGFAQEQRRYWIEGIPSDKKQLRWSILRDVFHWVD